MTNHSLEDDIRRICAEVVLEREQQWKDTPQARLLRSIMLTPDEPVTIKDFRGALA